MAKSSFLSHKFLSLLGALKDKQTLAINWKVQPDWVRIRNAMHQKISFPTWTSPSRSVGSRQCSRISEKVNGARPVCPATRP